MPSLHPSAKRYSLSDLAYLSSIYATSQLPYPVTTWNTGNRETITDDFRSYVDQVYKSNGVVFACMLVRQLIFSQVVFRFAFNNNGRVGKLYGTPSLDVLRYPFGPNSTTSDLASRMIQDADLTGNFYAVSRGGRLWRRRPDKMNLVLDGDPSEDEFVTVVGYQYYPKGVNQTDDTFYMYRPEEVCHWTPIPDPSAEYRGMTPITPILREVRADSAATDHKLEFFENAATPNMVIKPPDTVKTSEQFQQFKAQLDENHVGRGNRHKNLYLAPGSDVTVVGKDMAQMEFSELQGRDETRICSAFGVPAVIVGVKEAMQGSSLNTGNYAMARRRFADGTMRPLYGSAASALQIIVPPDSPSSRLWYDDFGIAFFREDQKDAADITLTKATARRQLGDAGYEPDSITAYMISGDENDLVHTGLYSVQLQEPGSPKLPQPGPDLALAPDGSKPKSGPFEKPVTAPSKGPKNQG